MKIRITSVALLCALSTQLLTAHYYDYDFFDMVVRKTTGQVVSHSLSEHNDMRRNFVQELNLFFQLWIEKYPFTPKNPVEKVLLSLAPLVIKNGIVAQHKVKIEEEEDIIDDHGEFKLRKNGEIAKKKVRKRIAAIESFKEQTFVDVARVAMKNSFFLPEDWDIAQKEFYIRGHKVNVNLLKILHILNAFLGEKKLSDRKKEEFFQAFYRNPKKALKDISSYINYGRGATALLCNYLFYDLAARYFVQRLNATLPKKERLNRKQVRIVARYLTHRAVQGAICSINKVQRKYKR